MRIGPGLTCKTTDKVVKLEIGSGVLTNIHADSPLNLLAETPPRRKRKHNDEYFRLSLFNHLRTVTSVSKLFLD